MPNHNSQRRNSPDAHVHHQWVGAEKGGMGCIISVRTRRECPEDNLRDLTWGNNPICGIAWEREREKKKLLHKMLREHEWISKESYPAVYRSLLPSGGREVSGRQPESEGKGQSRPQRPASSTKLWAGSQLLTTSSWDPRWLTSARKVLTWDQLLRADTQHTWDSALAVPQGNRPPGPGRWLRQLTWDSALTKHLVAWAAQTWEGHEMHAQPSLCPCGALQNLNLSSLDLGSAGNPGPALDSSSSEQPGAWAV